MLNSGTYKVYFLLVERSFKTCWFIPGVGKLYSVKVKSEIIEHVIFLNGMRPSKGKTAARKHVNLARKTKLYLNLIIFGKCL